MSATDLFKRQAKKASGNLPGRLKALAQEAACSEREVAAVEATLKEMKAALKRLKEVDLVDAMTEAGVDQMTLKDGTAIKVAPFCSGSLPKDPVKRQRAIKWLERHGAGPLVKSTVSVIFSRDEHEDAVVLCKMMNEAGEPAVLESTVHASTLQAYVRERLVNGQKVDSDTLGLYTGTVAKVKLPTQPKPSK